MRTLALAAILLVPFFASASEPLEGWNLVWADEFDVDGLPNPESWSYETGFVRNKEKQYYTDARKENAQINDGVLTITARKEEYKDAQYTSASVHTQGKHDILYGRIEVRAQLPTGKGMWPAIWMLGSSHGKVRWPDCGEIDIMENVGYAPDMIHANIHTKKYNHSIGTGKGDKIKADAPYNSFHVYAIEWSEEKIDFFFDEQNYFTYKNEGTGNDAWPFDKPHYLILNAAIGGSWGGKEGLDDSIFPQKYMIDYVRVYQKK